MDEDIEQNPQWAGAVLDELFAIVKEKATTQDLCEIRRHVTKFIDEIETCDAKSGRTNYFPSIVQRHDDSFSSLCYVFTTQISCRVNK